MQAGDKNLVNADEAKTHFERLLRGCHKTSKLKKAKKPLQLAQDLRHGNLQRFYDPKEEVSHDAKTYFR